MGFLKRLFEMQVFLTGVLAGSMTKNGILEIVDMDIEDRESPSTIYCKDTGGRAIAVSVSVEELEEEQHESA